VQPTILLTQGTNERVTPIGRRTRPPARIIQMQSQIAQFTFPLDHKPLFDIGHVFEVAQHVVVGGLFDQICHSVPEFEKLDDSTWSGKLFCDISSCRPFNRLLPSGPSANQGIERLLQIIFTRYANKEYSEGIFVIRGEFGADWFTPILQHPMCILRQQILRRGNSSSDDTSSPSGSKMNPTFDSFVAFYMGPNVSQFCHQFRNVGYVPGFNCWYSPHFIYSRSFSQKQESPLLGRTPTMRPGSAVTENDESSELNAHDFLNDASGDEMDLDVPMEDLSKAASVLCNFTC
jgi:hypothetical protein